MSDPATRIPPSNGPVPLSTPPDPITTKKKTKRKHRKRKSQGHQLNVMGLPARNLQAGALFILAVLLLCVSLPHLVEGIQRITQSGSTSAWFLAIVFDLAQVVCEVALLLIPILEIKRPIHPACKGVIIACTLLSMTLNIDAFLQHAEGIKDITLATIFGAALPIGVLVLFYIGSAFLLSAEEEQK